MTRDELTTFLRENLRIQVNEIDRLRTCEVNIRLVLEDELLSEESFTISKE